MDEFFSKRNRDRCHKSLADGFSMSRFNTDALCFDCLEEERQHPDYFVLKSEILLLTFL